MPSDRARFSYNPHREYRSVVVQQGRVTLEADTNEQTILESEALRLETIDIVGAAGTPDDGYKVAAGSDKSGVVIGPGTMYAGGWRLSLPEQVSMGAQPDWVDMTPPAVPSGTSLIALLVTEQAISAIEDQALREVALGGPDTAARTRLMQQFVAIPVQGDTCMLAQEQATRELAKMGIDFDPDTLALTSEATLEVSFFPPPTPVDPCCPPAAGGYLGADNQLVRVTVTDFDAASNTGTLLWGWNNASFLYRATKVGGAGGTQVLTLSPPPIDAEHTPQPGQVVEVLQTSCVLGNAAEQNYVADREGLVIQLASGNIYNPDSKQLTMPSGPAIPDDPNTLFVRLWQAAVPFTAGQAAQLDLTSGLAVTVNISAAPSAPLAARPVWHFAVRPNTPQQVYPVKYLHHPQPPDGPRQWLCDLAVVSANEDESNVTVLADCRKHFVPLTEQTDDGGCCCVTLDPKEVIALGGLQRVVDAQAKKKGSVSLRPGKYVLTAPLHLTRKHAGFALSGCGPGVILEADPERIAEFAPGLITVYETTEIKLSKLELALCPVPIHLHFPVKKQQGNEEDTALEFATMIGVSVESVIGLTIEDCQFRYRLPTARKRIVVEVLGAGVFFQGPCSEIHILRNSFTAPVERGSTSDASGSLLMGIWFTPAGKVKTLKSYLADFEDELVESLRAVGQTFEDSEICGNTFSGMLVASTVYARLGHIQCNDNRVINSRGGLWFIDGDMGAFVEFFARAIKAQQDTDMSAQEKASLALLLKITEILYMGTFIWTAGILAYVSDAKRSSSWTGATHIMEPISAEARDILVGKYQTLGENRYNAYLANAKQTEMLRAAPAEGAATEPAEENAGQQAGGETEPKAAAPNAHASFNESDLKRMTNSLNTMRAASLHATMMGRVSETVLYMRNNDVELIPLSMAKESTTKNPSASLMGLLAMYASNSDTSFHGPIDQHIVVDPPNTGAETSALFISGNRVQVPNIESVAVLTLWEADTLINGNLFRQGRGTTQPVYGDFIRGLPCAVSMTVDPTLFALTGNIVHSDWLIVPDTRSTDSTDSTTVWEFMNTID